MHAHAQADARFHEVGISRSGCRCRQKGVAAAQIQVSDALLAAGDLASSNRIAGNCTLILAAGDSVNVDRITGNCMPLVLGMQPHTLHVQKRGMPPHTVPATLP